MRKLVLLLGNKNFIAESLCGKFDLLINKDNAKRLAKSGAHLGHEYTCAAYDASDKIDANLLCSLEGAISEGGILVLALPVENPEDIGDRSKYFDEASLAHRSHNGKSAPSNYLRRLGRMLASSEAAVITQSNIQDLDKLLLEARSHKNGSSVPDAFPEIDELLSNLDSGAAILIGPRGSGKSTRLAYAAKTLEYKNCAIAAPSLDCLERFRSLAGSVREISADDAARASEKYILIDEAGSIPLAKLENACASGKICIMTGTSEGYEGAGSGFGIKLEENLTKSGIKVSRLNLSKVFRHEPDDELSKLWKKIFVPCSEQPISLTNFENENFSIRRVTSAELAADDELLSETFGILRENHYRTKPSDLRELLDGADSEIRIMENGSGRVIGALWACMEKADSKITHDIFLNRRRPRGNLLPQTMMAHAGFKNAAWYEFMRIVRIAVSPKARRHGLGRALVDNLRRTMPQNIDFLGVSFGATSELMEFWHALGFSCIRLGARADAATGLSSAMMLCTCGRLHEQVLGEWRSSFLRDAIVQAPRALSRMDARIIDVALRGGDPEASLDKQNMRDLEALSDGNRDFEFALPALFAWMLAKPAAFATIDVSERAAFIARYVQYSQSDELRQEIVQNIRTAVKNSLADENKRHSM